MSGWAIFVDFVKAIAWPSAVLILAKWVKSELWADLRPLLRRLREAGPSGIKFDPAAEQRKENKALLPPGELKELPGISRTPAMKQIEIELHRQLSHINEDEHTDFLVRFLAQARLENHFERVYAVIFGSQIEGLKHLNASGRVTRNEAIEFFESVKMRFPDFYKDWNFDAWSGFLFNQYLIKWNGEAIELTDIGQDFLLYLVVTRRSEDKPF